MFKSIRKSKLSRFMACYLAIQLVGTVIAPTAAYALTSGPSQPEFNSFTPIGTSDMVNLSSGDFNYNIPIMDVGGYPLNLAYDSGITMDQEASWVGLGWNLNVGQIARNVRGIPDDFNGDLIRYENKSRENRTIGVGGYFTAALLGIDMLEANAGLSVSHNTFSGYTPTPSLGVSFKINENISLGVDFSSNIESGPTVSPRVNLSHIQKNSDGQAINKLSSGIGLGYNARQGLQSFNLSASYKRYSNSKNKGNLLNGLSGGISFNDQHYTPRNRAGLQTESYNFTLSGGPNFVIAQGEFQLKGFGSYQKIMPEEEDKNVSSYGYQNTEFSITSEEEGILDVNRLNDGVVNKNTNVLAVPNYTYDNYAIQGQGIGGSFRPHRGQVSYLYDRMVSDQSGSGSFGVEVASLFGAYGGFEVELTDASAISQKWENKNFSISKFLEHPDDDNDIDYEPYYFKNYGEFNVDPESSLFNIDLLGEQPIRLKIGGSSHNRILEPIWLSDDSTSPINSKIKRDERQLRNTAISSITKAEARYDPQVLYREDDAFVKDHHTAGMKVLKPDGSTYVFGEAVYNTNKIEASFDVSKKRLTADCSTGLIDYNPNLITNRSARSDGYLNKITTPAYAHSYLLSSVLSSDYEDLTGNGPTYDDLGTYTKFYYKNHSSENYNWRTPYSQNKAAYNEGLKSHQEDEKANYIYGEKELKYIQKIETKTHVAVFKLSDRLDARGVIGEHGGMSTSEGSAMMQLNKIYLFSKPEYTNELRNALENDNPSDDPSEEELMKSTIKIAHFEYNYDLCPGILNSETGEGKLTLEKVYFTYRDSYMGKHTPYIFNYADFDGDGFMEANYPYNLKGYDIWGNYKPNESNGNCSAVSAPLSTIEFPYVNQDKNLADDFSRAWSLSSIKLPSGGKIDVRLEADDYQYVQERRAMQMFKVVGAGLDAGVNGEIPNSFSNTTSPYEVKSLYDANNDHYPYLYVLIDESEMGLSQQQFLDTYLKGQIDKPIFFRFLLNMFNTDANLFDFVEGYFLIDSEKINNINVFSDSENTYAAIPMKFLDLEGIANTNVVNPISKAGWYFGRQYLRRLVYGDEGDLNTDSFEDVIEGIFDAIEGMMELVESPNGILEQKGIAKHFIENKSWVRLVNPSGVKYGGGARVASIKLYDQWNQMTPNGFQQFYGQEYGYQLEDTENISDSVVFTSSGVATFESNSSKENPYVEPFFGNSNDNSYRDKINAPKESNYVERPIAASFYPSATVTYSKVTVKNLERTIDEQVLSKHATGKVVTEHYTSRDFPTQTDFTIFDAKMDSPSALAQIFNFSVRNHLTASQGFVVETNDMNGKIKRQQVYAENKLAPISGTEYIYNTDQEDLRRLDNNLKTIDEKGQINWQIIGVEYEVVNDFRENNTKTLTGGVNQNFTLTGLPFVPILPAPLPTMAKHESLLRTASTMKHIHKNGVLIEKKAFDLGSNISTKNIAWDSKTGEVLLTQTINEYNDNYYNFNYPVHWYDYYKGMGQATKNIAMRGQLDRNPETGYFELSSRTNTTVLNAKDFLLEGDELFLEKTSDETEEIFIPKTYWVAGFDDSNHILLMDINGIILDECLEDEQTTYVFKITRSGYRNQQTASMASITSMRNPLDLNPSGLTSSSFVEDVATGPAHRIINASAVRYKEYWPEHYERNLVPLYLNNGVLDMTKQRANPFVQNMKAEWRALSSYAYLTGRDFNTDTEAVGSSPRNEGFFTEFKPFYRVSDSPVENWAIFTEDWRFASSISKYSPYGNELENVDALNRFSAAQFGYNHMLPVAVGSNSKYQEMGFNSFENSWGISTQGLNNNEHFGFSNGTITSEASHSGDYSIALVGSGDMVTGEYSLVQDEAPPREVECEITSVPPSGPSLCSGVDGPINLCIGASGYFISPSSYDFGPSGPDPDNPVDIIPHNQESTQLYVNINPQNEVFIGFSFPLCQDDNNSILDFSITYNSANGTTSTCRYPLRNIVIENCFAAGCPDGECCN